MKNKSRYFAIYLILAFSSLNVFAQSVGFEKTYTAWNINKPLTYVCSDKCSDGGYVIAASNAGSNWTLDNTQIYLLKLNANGDSLWAQNYGGISNDQIYCIKQTSDGGFILVGGSNTNVYPNYEPDIYMLKVDGAGSFMWEKYLDPGWFYGWANDVIEYPDGSFALCGYAFVSWEECAFVMKTTPSVNVQWTEFYINTCGGDPRFNFKQTSDGGYAINAHTGITAPWERFQLIKTDLYGSRTWGKIYYLIGDAMYGASVAQDAELTNDGGYIQIGETFNNTDSYNYGTLIKANNVGTKQWEKLYNDIYLNTNILTTADNGFVCAGWNLTSNEIIKFNSLGDTLWKVSYGSYLPYYSIAPTTLIRTMDQELFISGTQSPPGFDKKIYVFKTSGLSSQITGIKEDKTKQPIHSFVYPNPFSTFTSITLNSGISIKNAFVVIYDVLGKEINRYEMSNNQITLSKNDYDNGIYFYKIFSENTEISNGKIIAN